MFGQCPAPKPHCVFTPTYLLCKVENTYLIASFYIIMVERQLPIFLFKVQMTHQLTIAKYLENNND